MTRYKLFAFKIITVCIVPILTILVLELGLRVVGFGYSTKVFVEENGIVRNNWPFTLKYFPWSVARPMKSLQFPAKKEPDSLRIFVLGGSAAQGFPAVEFGMASQIQVMLEQAYPGRTIEVINTAISAVNSHVMLPVAKACLKYDPDFLMIYLGNNEVVGPYGAGSLYFGASNNLMFLRLSDAIKSLRLYQMILMLTGKHHVATGTWKGMEYFVENALFEDDKRLQTVYRHFDRNLSDIISAAADKDCPVVLSTVGVNLLDCPPFVSRKSEHANASYQTGLADLAAGKPKEALAALKKARDLDGLRFRADKTVNAMIRQQAARQEEWVTLVDSEQLFEQGESGAISIPGDDLFYDHVHLSFAGNFKVATALSGAVISQDSPSATFPVSREQVSSALAYSEWDELRISQKLTEQLLGKPPYTNQLNHRQKQLSRQREARKMASRFSPEAREKSLQLYQTVMDEWPDDADLKRRMSRLLVDAGDSEKARELLLSAAGESSGNFEILYQLSLVSVSLKKYDEAEQSLLKILERNPYSIEVRNAYLLLLFNSKRFAEAARYNEKLFRDHPDDPDFRHLYALILNAQGKRSEAWEQLQKALKIDPTHSKTRILMVETLQRDNKLAQALRVARSWSRAEPDSSEAHFEEAKLLSREKNYKEAMEHYRKVFELDPDFVAARSNYVQFLAGQGRIQEAIQSLGEDLNKDPEIREGHSMLGLLLDVAGMRSEAMRTFSAGLERDPNNLKILRELAWIKATSKDAQWRNGAEAVQLAKRAVEWAPQDPDFLQVLAAAYAENRQFDDAVLSARRALRLADVTNNKQLSELIRKCIPAYENRQPIRIN
jgi:tetratricopeptide (TPR) repeat protein